MIVVKRTDYRAEDGSKIHEFIGQNESWPLAAYKVADANEYNRYETENTLTYLWDPLLGKPAITHLEVVEL